jgi:hypothetical protein
VSWFTLTSGVEAVSGASGGLTAFTGMRFPLLVTLSRPSLSSRGDIVAASGVEVRAAIWPTRQRKMLGAVGEVFTVEAIAFFPRDTNVQRRDRVQDGAQLYEVVQTHVGRDDRGIEDHVGAYLAHAPEGAS